MKRTKFKTETPKTDTKLKPLDVVEYIGEGINNNQIFTINKVDEGLAACIRNYDGVRQTLRLQNLKLYEL